MRGVIQNEEYVGLALREGREFVVMCESEKDANSKRISLYNVRKRLTAEEQKKVQIKKLCENGQWMVKISRGRPEVFEIVKGELVPVIEELKLSSSSLNILKDMIDQGLDTDSIVEILTDRGEEEQAIRKELEELGGKA